MIKRITLRNFKGWRELPGLELRDITVLFGANSSGKTSILQSLLMLKQTAESVDRKRALHFGGSSKDYVDLGSFRAVIHKHQEDSALDVELIWEATETPDFGVPAHSGSVREFVYHASWATIEGEVRLTKLHYSNGPRKATLSRADDGTYDSQFSGFARGRGRPAKAGPESCYIVPAAAARQFTYAAPLEFSHQFEVLMQRIAYLGPLRQFPRRLYHWTGERPMAMDPMGSNALEMLVAAAAERADGPRSRSRRSTVITELESWLSGLRLATAFSVEAVDKDRRVYEVSLEPANAPSRSVIPDVGFGVSQVLPVVVLLLTAPEHSVVLLEQPEIHLHPSVQAGLADLFLELAEQRSLQLLIESHSEHLLRRLQRRIAEHEQKLATPDHVRLYFCGVAPEGCQLQDVSTDLFGRISNWPDGFFGNEVDDLDAMTQAALNRKKEAAVRG